MEAKDGWEQTHLWALLYIYKLLLFLMSKGTVMLFEKAPKECQF